MKRLQNLEDLMRPGGAEAAKVPPNSVPTLNEPCPIDFSPMKLDVDTALLQLQERVPEIIGWLEKLRDGAFDYNTARSLLLTTLRTFGFAIEDLFNGAGELKDAGRASTISAIAYDILNDGVKDDAE